MTYWAEDPYKLGAPDPVDLVAPLPLQVETAYLQHVAAAVALDWGTLAEAIVAEGEDVPTWVTAAMGKLDGVVDDLGELLVYLDAHMPKPAPADLEVFVDPEDMKWTGRELTGDEGAPPTVAPAPTPPKPEFVCQTCGLDAENPVDHEDATGHWPTYAGV